MGALNRGVEAQNGAVEGLYDNGAELHHFDEEQDPHQSDRSDLDQHQSK